MSTRTIQVQPKTLQGNINNTDTQFIIEDFVGLDGLVILQADIGGVNDVLYGTFEPNSVREEGFSAKILSNSGTTVTFECTRGLLGKHPYGTGGIAYPHDAGSKIVFSNNPNLFNKFIAKDNTEVVTGDIQVPTPAGNDSVVPKEYVDDNFVANSGDETVAGVKTFSSSPIVPTPTTDFQASTKKYADDLAIAGAPDASTTVKGIVEEATQDEIYSYTDVGSTGAKLFVNPDKLSISLVAGEALTANDALMIADGTESKIVSAESTNNSVFNSVLNTTWLYQSFTTGPETTSIGAVTLYMVNSGDTYTLRIRATPTGADIASVTVETGFIAGEVNFTFGANTVSPSTTYYLVVSATSLNPGNPEHYWYGGTTSSYSGGVSGRSTDSGANWTTPASTVTGDFYFRLFEKCLTAGRVYKASANIGASSTNNRISPNWVNNFIGFATASVSALANVKISSWNILKGFSGLVAGSIYYISNTAGGISSTAGVSSKKVGIAIESDKLLIKNDN